jgi:hypothetical protein
MQTADESPAVGQTTPRTRWEAVRSTWLTEDSAAVRELSARYQVRIATTDASGVAVHELRNRTNFTAASPLGDALLSAADDSPGEPPTAVVFLTDGNVTAGASLSSAAERLRQRLIPVFVGGVGSATGPRDIALDDVLLEDDAYVGDLVAAHVRLSVRGAEGPVAVELRDETTGEVLAKAAVAVAAADRAVPLRRGEGVLRFRPPAAGALTLRIAAEPLANELRLENNRRQRTLHVHPARLRVLLAWGTPSYEFRYLKALLERELRSAAATTDADDNSSLLHVYLHDADPEHAEQDRSALRSFPTAEELNRYDVIICGDLPPSAVRPETLAAIRAWVEDQGQASWQSSCQGWC